jgi:SAM-dependent methyltransferase
MTGTASRVQYLSPPAPVRMADEYYGLASLEHFWVRRRFEVLRRIAGDTLNRAALIADVGCGHGILQRQIEDHYAKTVTGFDLNEFALKQSAARTSPVCCYDIFQRNSEYERHFEIILLFDVLEHIPEEQDFLRAIQFHLAAKGTLIVNVPALQLLWSRYDEVTGHCRRYTFRALNAVAQHCGMRVRTWSYWGLPLVPLLMARKIWVSRLPSEEVYSAGFQSNVGPLNRLLLGLSRIEPMPQHVTGSSLMAVLEKS